MPCKNFYHTTFFKFLHSLALQFSMLLPLLQVFAIFQAHSPHSYYNTHHKSQSYNGTTLNANKFDDHFFLFFLFKITHCFKINCSFFQAPCSFRDGLTPVHLHGSNYYPSMVQMHSNIFHSSKCHHHHISFHPSSFIMSTMCVVIYSDLLRLSFSRIII